MHAIHPDGCTSWPQPSFSPCAYDWLGILWHNIGWYSCERRPYPWHSEKPTQPGWYVLRLDGIDDVVQVCEELGSLMVAPTRTANAWEYVHAITNGLWKGPLDLATL